MKLAMRKERAQKWGIRGLMRKSGIELLRIITMLMIVCLHYLSKGGALKTPIYDLNANSYIAWLVEAFCLVAVNVYVLISGYFASPSSAKFNKTKRLWLQVWLYSLGIGIISIFFGQKYTVYEFFTLIFPIVTEHYWFATSFLLLSLTAPFLQNGCENIEKASFQKILLSFILFTSISKTILPMHLPWDKSGYDLIWFITLYLTGMYLKKFGLPDMLKNKKRPLCMYFVCELMIFAVMLLIRQLYLYTGSLEEFITYTYSYNHLLCYLGAVGLFGFFLNLGSMPEKISSLINRLAGATFGVYLIHEHVSVRCRWQGWFKCEKMLEKPAPVFVLHMICTVFAVYICCTAIELLRQSVFQRGEKKLNG